MADEKTTDAVFDRPPLIETIMGVHFAPLKCLTAAHLGWFWKTHLGSDWEKVAESLPIPDAFERFDSPLPRPSGVKLEAGRPPARVQISHVSNGRMIQIQPTQFHYNRNRIGGEYPRYKVVRAEFDRWFELFSRFVLDAKLGDITPNQWELTYIDGIPRGNLWDTPADWNQVLPGLLSSPGFLGTHRLESFGGEWHFEILPQRGRVHVAVQLARVGDASEPVLLLQATARGPIGKEGVATVEEGLEIGHRAALDLFVGTTSAKAHQAWGRSS